MKLRCGQFELDLSKPQLMGILNVTPDSFSDGGHFDRIETAIEHARQMVAAGADIIDIGGESTRPGAASVSEDEELERVIPVIEALVKEFSLPLSVDTSKAVVMYEAVQAGASIINDVCALQNEGSLQVAAQMQHEKQTAICLMHMQGQPRNMQTDPRYSDVVSDVKDFLLKRVQQCVAAGMDEMQIILDPGFGFGKTLQHNLQLLNALPRFVDCGHPVLAGLSRKSMIADMTGQALAQRLAGSLTLATLAAQAGAHIIRVHDVAETRDVVDIVHAVKMVE